MNLKELSFSESLQSDEKHLVNQVQDADVTTSFHGMLTTNPHVINEFQSEVCDRHLNIEIDANTETNLLKKDPIDQTDFLQKQLSCLGKSDPTEIMYTESPHSYLTSVASKTQREVYIGNLPHGLTVTELLEYVNSSITKNNALPKDEHPVISAWINSDGKYAFCECRSIEGTTALLNLNNLLNINGHLLRIGKPKVSEQVNCDNSINSSALINQATQNTSIISPYFNNIPLVLKKETILITGIDHLLSIEDVRKIFGNNKRIKVLELLSHRKKYKAAICEVEPNVKFIDNIINKLGVDINIVKMKHVKSKIIHSINSHLKIIVGKTMNYYEHRYKDKSLDDRIDAIQRTLFLPQKPCRCILISRILINEELLIPNKYSSIHEEIHEKCSSYGKIFKTIIPKPETLLIDQDQNFGLHFGRAFVFFFSVESAIKAKVDLHNMRFLGRNLKISYYSEREFLNNSFYLSEPNRCDPMDDKELSRILSNI
ncbi:splicing factor U2AF U2 snRNP auxiliary factor large subunit protein [Cryptosporidium canis]|uniref:Splicing factor U2AF U2 snRNP auxiliary factor large subunit protein n=1 Tax=Cryptosporidium canis TaxID=195482 RepID=A0A9D5DM58_9CRYT|nr:splicing factor U2AF U2 snRNP auxiliary factor large subunit protein [Cryptosporidium canis]